MRMTMKKMKKMKATKGKTKNPQEKKLAVKGRF